MEIPRPFNLATPKATFASKIITGLNVRRAPAHAAWVAEVVCEDFVCEARSRICTADLKTAWLRAEMYCGIRMGQHTGHRMSPFRILGLEEYICQKLWNPTGPRTGALLPAGTSKFAQVGKSECTRFTISGHSVFTMGASTDLTGAIYRE